ncbi:uncharacterized protein GGS22DRAFT_197603 [Annulohypoxylon maeteangense]|uniref:uncharacterized protein n=1 Tax=Annulohypoxylon maeteangense TaxID=1927788 RepID=UPI00200741FE|nr:uncharacterized protein GGS22DRAFT_197603 [Annulohypoxylon maeteangense]KAI0880298.1 hypothetical protein GGS22DRAFT_197603 [Annulohypoxylon maeteangense]
MGIQTAMPPNSSPSNGMTGHSPIPQIENIVKKDNPFNYMPTFSKSGKAGQTTRPQSSMQSHSFQIKLIDLCTEHQGTYFKCEDLAEFWDKVSHSLALGSSFPITRNDVEGWVEEICREAKGSLLHREIFPHRAGREDLDIAIEDWLEIEGRRRFQHGFSEMIKGYLLAYGPEESEEEDLLTYSCLNRLRENMDRVKTAMSDKGEASRRNGAILIHKVELLASMPSIKSTQQALSPEELHDYTDDQSHEIRFPPLIPNADIPSDPPPLSHAGSQYQVVGPSSITESVGNGSPNLPSRLSDEVDGSQSPAIELFSDQKLPGTSVHLKRPLHDLSVQGDHQSVPGFPAIKKSAIELGSTGKPEISKKRKVQKGKGVDRSRQLLRKDNSLPNANLNIPSTPCSTQDPVAIDVSQNTQNQQQPGAGEEFHVNSHLAGQEYANALAATPSTTTRKARKKKGTVEKQTLTNKKHLKQTNETNHSAIPSQRVPLDSLTCNSDKGPAQNPFGNVPVIDLTRSPDQEVVKQELGRATEGLEGQIIRLTANLNGVVGLTPEKIKDIIDRSVSARLNDAAYQIVERFDKTLENKLSQLKKTLEES